jgi:thioredoxin-related protein
MPLNRFRQRECFLCNEMKQKMYREPFLQAITPTLTTIAIGLKQKKMPLSIILFLSTPSIIIMETHN